MQPAKPRTVKQSLITLGGKAGSLLPSPSYLTPELLIPTSCPPWQRGGREVQGDTGATSLAKTGTSSGVTVIGDKMSCVQAGTKK